MSTPINGGDFILKKSKLIAKFSLNIVLLEAILANY
ncbi:winged-helix domain-containing protein [Nitrosomonas sp.]